MNETTPLDLLQRLYPLLRGGRMPFPWMEKLFLRLLQGKAPALVDLPTGSGKTDLVLVWLIALVYFGNNQNTHPLPRRLVWVVNRKVLVGQIYRLASSILQQIDKIDEVRNGLLALSPSTENRETLNIVQLRGQVVADREWSFSPASATLIIGTVDQLGSRLLFQGYGLGKRERPLQAGLFGVDAWVCVDEAHLVPAFILTMRQLRKQIASEVAADCPALIKDQFNRLPWYFTELSATPGLPAPGIDEQLVLSEEDEAHPVLSQRIAGGKAKRIEQIACSETEVVEKITSKALSLQHQQQRVAIYVRKPDTARKVKAGIEKGLPKPEKGKQFDRLLIITGRMRGVEREELSDNPVFKALSTESRRPTDDPESPLGRPVATVYLIGTSAAEVGVDTDADVILCDFASMDTLIQRLGRLDRLGIITSAGNTPTMHIFGSPKPDQKALNHAKIVCTSLNGQPYLPSPMLLAGNAWSGGPKVDEIIESTTASVLQDGQSPADWRHHALAAATVRPTFCQPLTFPILENWTATTLRPNPNLPVDPWLYGFGEDDSTPLVGLIFRRELDALVGLADEESDDPDEPNEYARRKSAILGILEKFPPAKSEAHWVPVYLVRDWLLGKLEKNKTERTVFEAPALLSMRDESEWIILGSDDQQLRENLAARLFSETILILPTLAAIPKPIGEELTHNSPEMDQTDRADDAWGKEKDTPAKWIRTTNQPSSGRDGFVEKNSFSVNYAPVRDAQGSVTKDGYATQLRYYLPLSATQNQDQLLTDHQESARTYAHGLAQSVFGNAPYLAEFYARLGLVHDAGKASPLWQNAIGNRYPRPPLAKTSKVISPEKFQGYRHEWGSLTAAPTEASRTELLGQVPEQEQAFYSMLFDHLIGTHHGHLRPSLPDQPNYHPAQLDSERCAAALRWHQLQSTLGPWRLAYLEALLKAADTLASKDSQTTSNPDEA